MNAALALNAAGGGVSFRRTELPWNTASADDSRFRRLQRGVVGAVLLLALVVPWLPLPQPDRSQPTVLPTPMAKLLLERQATPPKPVTPPEPSKEAVAPTPAEKEQAPPKNANPKPDQPNVPEARNPIAGRTPGEEAARKRASGVGLLAMKNELADLTGAPAAVQMRQDIAPGPGVGTGTGAGVGAGTETGVPVRAMITAQSGRGSGGINTGAYSRDAGGGGQAGRASTLVERVARGGGGGGPGGGGGSVKGGGNAQANAGGTLTKADKGKASRSLEEIKLVFERHKGAIYALYNRALRDDPSLQGKVVMELKIAPSGQITDLRIVASELKNEDLERKLLARVRQFDFGAKDVEVMVVTWPVDFLPS